MSDLDELMALRPKVSELIHALEQERRDHTKTRQERDAKEAMNAQLRAQIVAMREAYRSNATPPLGTPSTETRALSKRWTETT